MHSPKIALQCMKKMHVKQKISEKERVQWTYRLIKRKTLQKFSRKTTKNCCGALPSRRERGKFENFLKKML